MKSTQKTYFIWLLLLAFGWAQVSSIQHLCQCTDAPHSHETAHSTSPLNNTDCCEDEAVINDKVLEHGKSHQTSDANHHCGYCENFCAHDSVAFQHGECSLAAAHQQVFSTRELVEVYFSLQIAAANISVIPSKPPRLLNSFIDHSVRPASPPLFLINSAFLI